MSHDLRSRSVGWICVWSASLAAVFCTPFIDLAGSRKAWAESLVMRDGRVIEGTLATVAGLAENPLKTKSGDGPAVRPILMVDNNLTRTFVEKSHVMKMQEGNEQQPLAFVKIQIPQRVAVAGFHIARLGPIVRMQPFDEWGRRIVTIMSDKGPLDVIQGITEITPLWTKVQGIATKPAYIWDMRLATSSIPRETLSKIISKQIDPKNENDRLKLVKLYLQSERYADAQHELAAIIEDFPGQEEQQKEIRAIQQLSSRKVIDEIKVRRKAGQHRFVYELLQNFPRKDIAGETLQQVRQMLDAYTDTEKQGHAILADLEKNLAGVKDASLTRGGPRPIVEGDHRGVQYQHARSHGRLSAIAERRGTVRRTKAVAGHQWLAIRLEPCLDQFGRFAVARRSAQAGPGVFARAGQAEAQRLADRDAWPRRWHAGNGRSDRCTHETANRQSRGGPRQAWDTSFNSRFPAWIRNRTSLTTSSCRPNTIPIAAIRP